MNDGDLGTFGIGGSSLARLGLDDQVSVDGLHGQSVDGIGSNDGGSATVGCSEGNAGFGREYSSDGGHGGASIRNDVDNLGDVVDGSGHASTTIGDVHGVAFELGAEGTNGTNLNAGNVKTEAEGLGGEVGDLFGQVSGVGGSNGLDGEQVVVAVHVFNGHELSGTVLGGLEGDLAVDGFSVNAGLGDARVDLFGNLQVGGASGESDGVGTAVAGDLQNLGVAEDAIGAIGIALAFGGEVEGGFGASSGFNNLDVQLLGVASEVGFVDVDQDLVGVDAFGFDGLRSVEKVNRAKGGVTGDAVDGLESGVDLSLGGSDLVGALRTGLSGFEGQTLHLVQQGVDFSKSAFSCGQHGDGVLGVFNSLGDGVDLRTEFLRDDQVSRAIGSLVDFQARGELGQGVG